VSGATTATGFEGQAFQFDGIDDFIDAPVAINPSLRPKLTMGAWVKLDTLPPGGSGAPDRAIVLSHDNGGGDRTLGVGVFPAIPEGWFAFTGDQPWVHGFLPAIPITTWTFIAVVYDQTAQRADLYIDGDASTTADALQHYAQVGFNQGDGLGYVRIGANPIGHGYLDGAIDNVFLYDEALTAEDVTLIRDGGAAAINAPCGNQIVEVGEQCDDGNTTAGDGCSEICDVEIPVARQRLKCLTKVASAAALYANGVVKARQACLLGQLKAAVPIDGVDCRAAATGNAKTDAKLASLRSGLTRSLASGCTGIVLEALGLPGDCVDPGGPPFTVAELDACIAETHASRAGEMVDLQLPVP
jgi:cysteine-rich repeat protein